VLLEIEIGSVADVAADVLGAAIRSAEVKARRPLGRDEIGRRPEEQAIDDAEHRRIGTDTESERGDHSDGEARLEPKAAHRVAQILREGAPPFGAPLLIDSRAVDFGETLPRARNVAKAALGFATRVV